MPSTGWAAPNRTQRPSASPPQAVASQKASTTESLASPRPPKRRDSTPGWPRGRPWRSCPPARTGLPGKQVLRLRFTARGMSNKEKSPAFAQLARAPIGQLLARSTTKRKRRSLRSNRTVRQRSSDLTSALPISCGMPVTSAFPIQKARCPSLMPVLVHPRGKHCSWSSSSGTRRRIVKRKVSHFEAS